MKENKNIDELFQSLGDFEMDPPTRVKTQIDARLDKSASRKIVFFIVSAAIVIAGILGTWLQLKNDDSSKSTVVAEKTTDLISDKDPKKLNADQTNKVSEGESGTIEKQTEIIEREKLETAASNAEEVKNAENNITKLPTVSKEAETPVKPEEARNGVIEKQNKRIKITMLEPNRLETENAPNVVETKEVTPLEPVSKEIVVKEKASKEQGEKEVVAKNESITEKKEVTNREQEKGATTSEPKKEAVSVNRLKMRGKGMWMLGVLAGPTIGFNSVTSDVDDNMKEQVGYGFGIDLKRNLTNGFSIKTGISYSARNEVYSTREPHQLIDNNDTTIGFANKDTKEQVVSYTVPLLLGWQLPVSERWRMESNVGVQFDMRSFNYLSKDVAPIKNVMYAKFGMQVAAQVRAVYQINNFGWSIGVLGVKDLSPAIQYPTMDRKRSFIQPQIAVHWIF